MKIIYSKIICFLLSFTSSLFVSETSAQPTNKINYQAVARDVNGDELQNQNIGLRISILNGSGGPSLYTETFNLNTNNFGLFTIQIGGGVLVSGNYGTIDWSAGNQWLKVEMDPAGGSAYVNMGESQLLSVPYALYAASSGQWTVNGTEISNANTGDVGIGTSSPGAQLHVVSSGNQAMIIDGASPMYVGLREGGAYRGYIGSYSGNADDVDFGTGTGNTTGSVHLTIEATPILTVASDGNVGIGTTAPGKAFEVVTSDFDIANFKTTGSSDARILFSTNAGVKGSLGWTPFNNTMALSSYGADDVSIGVNNLSVEAIRIKTTTGRVGIKTTAPLSTFNVAHVTGSLTEGIGLTNTSVNSTWYFYSGAAGNLFIGKASNLGSFDGVTGVYTSLSDRRVKTNVSALSAVLPSVMNLEIKKYEFSKNNPEHRKSIGLMAQDVANYFPELVYNFRDDATGVDYLSMDYSGFGVIALKAIQEQQKIIEGLKAEINALKSSLQSPKK